MPTGERRDRRHLWGFISPLISSILVALASWYVYSAGNSTLYISNWSARLYVTLREFDFRENFSAFGSVWSPMEGFGQRSLENPLWLNLGMTHMIFTGGRFVEAYYGLSLGIAIFISTYFMSRRLALTQGGSVICGVLATFVILFPSSYQWQRQTIQSGSLILLPIAVSLALGLARDEQLKTRNRVLNAVALGIVTLFFTFSMGLGSSLFLIPVFLVLTIDIARSVMSRKIPLGWQVGKALVASLAVGPQLVPQFEFIQLFRQARQVTQASQSLGGLPRSYWGDLAQPYSWYRWLILGGLATIFFFGFSKRSCRGFSYLGVTCLLFTIFVSISNAVAIQSRGNEVLPSANYFIVALIPVIIVAAVGVSTNLNVRGLHRADVYIPSPGGKLRTLIVCAPALGLLAWSVIWVQKNEWMRDVRINSIEKYQEDAIRPVGGLFIPVDRLNSRGEVLPILEELACTLMSLSIRGGTSEFCGRVLLVDSETQTNPSIPRRDPTWVSGLYEDLSVHGVPVVNSYGSRYSGPFWRFTRLAFSDRSEVIRAWTVYNRFNLPIAQQFGVKVVVSDRLIPQLKLVREFSLTDRSGIRTRLFQYRVPDVQLSGAYVSKIVEVKSFSDVIERMGAQPSNRNVAYRTNTLDQFVSDAPLLPPAWFSLRVGLNSVHVSGESRGRSVVLLPFEYSSCLKLDYGAEDPPVLLRLNGIQLAVLFDKTVNAVIRLRDSGFGIQSCWSQDLLSSKELE